MLGKFIGGHGDGLHELSSLGQTLVGLPANFFGQGWPAWVDGSMLLAAAMLVARMRPTARLLIPATALALMAPFAAARIHGDVDLRLAFVPWWASCVLIAFALAGRGTASNASPEPSPRSLHWRRRVGLVTSVLAVASLLGLAGAKRVQAERAYRPQAEAFDVQGRFVWENGPTAAYVPWGALSGYLHVQYASHVIRTRLLGQPGPRSAPFPESAAALLGSVPLHVYDPACACMKVHPPEARNSTPTTGVLPPAIRFSRHAGGLSWSLASRPDDRCYMRAETWNAAFVLPCAGDLPFDLPYLKGDFRFVVRSADGAWEMTPTLTLPPGAFALEWTRPADGRSPP
jgi:hypothetical protein